jgi:hypothetical protein
MRRMQDKHCGAWATNADAIAVAQDVAFSIYKIQLRDVFEICVNHTVMCL